MTLHATLARALLEHGVDTIFGLMGDANMYYLAHFKDQGGRFVGAAHEGNAVGMADAFSRVSGQIGVASVTHGPALTNTMTFLVEAVRSGSQVLLLTGDTPREPTHFQRVDIAAVAAAAGAGYEQVYRSRSLVRDLNRAMQRVVSERRPVVLNVPIDLLDEADAAQVPVAAVRPRGRMSPEPAALDAALGLIASARRPIVLAGRGAVDSGARDELVALADLLGAPLATSLLAKDYFRGEPSDIGIFGNLSHPVASQAISEADAIIAFGASLNAYTTHGRKLLADKLSVHVDYDVAAIGAYAPVTEALAGDARLTAARMRDELGAAQFTANRRWLEGIQQQLRTYTPGDDFSDRSGAGTVDVRSACIALDRALPAARTLVSDIGRFVLGAWPYLHVENAAHFTTMGGFGSIGLGLAGAIGAAVATPGRPTVLAVGDGGLMMHLSELSTAVRERLPLILVVLNDGAYGAEFYKLEAVGLNPDHSRNVWPQLASIATSFGATAVTVTELDDLEQVEDLAKNLDGPLVVDVHLDPTVNLV